MTPEELAAIQDRWDDWYAEDDGEPPSADWSMRDDMEMDEPESLSHCIVRNDVPALLAELRRLRTCDSVRRYVDPHGTYTADLRCDGADRHRNLHSAPIGDGYRYTWGKQ